MDENQTQETEVIEGATETPQAPETPIETPTPPAPKTLGEVLDEADLDELRRHPRFAGIVGSEIQRREQTNRSKAEEERRQRVQDDMLKLLTENEDWVKANYPELHPHIGELQRSRATKELTSVREKAIEDLSTEIGKACHQLPEWKDLTPDDHEQLARAVMGKPTEEILAVFNKTAIDLIAERRAKKRLEEWTSKELKAVRESIRQEEAAKLMEKDDAPDSARPKGRPGAIDISKMSDSEFDKYWNTHIKK